MSPDMPFRKRLPHDIPSWVNDEEVFFITINCRMRGENQLTKSACAETIRASFEHRMSKGQWWTHLLLLMPDHLHALMVFPGDVQMRKVIFQWKEWVAKQTEIRWQRDFFDHRLRGVESFREKASYIRNNPVRKGLVARAEHWPYVWTWNEHEIFKPLDPPSAAVGLH